MTAIVRIERGMPMAVGDRKRSWQIVLDGRPAGQIALSEVVEIGIEPGPHTLRLTSTGSRHSPERTLAKSQGLKVKVNG